MNAAPSQRFQLPPIAPADRSITLDAVRGIALFGVLIVNLLTGFRVSLFEEILLFHTHPGAANHVVDILTAFMFEFKAFALFSILFGVGVGVQLDRSERHNLRAAPFLARRFAALLLIGLIHMFVIWNGDILVLYAVCGLLLIPVTRIPTRRIGVLGLTIVSLVPWLPWFNAWLPDESAMRAHACIAVRVYATGSFTDIMALRFDEAVNFIVPLLISALPRTLGLMLIGIALWRSRFLQRADHLPRVTFAAGSLGFILTALHVRSRHTGQELVHGFEWLYTYASVLLAFAYGALLWRCLRAKQNGPVRLLAATGRMALTNYLAQSVIFGMVFYGYGLGLFGKLGSAVTAPLGLAVFVAQAVASDLWLRHFRFGPVEWLWRAVTYRHLQPMTLHSSKRRWRRPGTLPCT